MNNISLVGRVTRDIELKTTANGTNYARFTLAVKKRLDENGTDFFVVTAWRGQAEVLAKYVKKGDQLAIWGSMESRSYDKEDGTKVTVWEVVMQGSTFINERKEKKEQDLTPIEDDDCPF